MSTPRCPNSLLASLQRKDREPLLAESETVRLVLGEVLWEPSQRIRHVYFPIDGFISKLFPADTHENLELGLIGNEGMIGIPLVLGVNATMMQAIVQGSGTAFRVDAAAFKRKLDRFPALRQQLHRYIYVTMMQLALATTCNSYHALEARLARWLLMTHDKAQFGGFQLTHAFLAQMLGVRRAGVTNAAGRLQKQEIIRYSRGKIAVLNRGGLEKMSCSCYRTAEDTYQRILGSVTRAPS